MPDLIQTLLYHAQPLDPIPLTTLGISASPNLTDHRGVSYSTMAA